MLVLSFTSCGTTRIVTYRSDVDIYVNYEFKGKGEARVTRTGLPDKMHVSAKYNGEEVGASDVRRKFTFMTFLGGICTYYVGFVLFWQYPETVIIPIKNIEQKKTTFDQKEKSVWDLPPGEWK